MKNKKIINLVMAAVFAALIAVMTAYVSIKTGLNEGYIHFGDSIIYIAACILPFPYAALAAGIGGGLADLLAGAAIWAPVTVIIKALNVIPFALVYKFKMTKKPDKILNGATAAMPIASGLITLLGYTLAEKIMFGLQYDSLWIFILTGLIQPIGSAIMFYLIAAALDRVNFKNRIAKTK
ncbi:MAG: TIGR04002 family protein [Oscillospiraceae bacterium]